MLDPHRRFNPLKNEWVLVSPQRTKRPWLGGIHENDGAKTNPYEKDCYLCPRNARANGIQNPDYKGVFLFDNDFPALNLENSQEMQESRGFFQYKSEKGICRVLCFSPRHDLTFPELGHDQILNIIEAWITEYARISQIPKIKNIQIFENKGELMGCSNPHPHCQIWAQTELPNEIFVELNTQREYFHQNQQPMLLRYVEEERIKAERIVDTNKHFTALVPFWAIWPFEILILPHRNIHRLDECTPEEKNALAAIMQRITTRYDNLFEISFPYSMGLHQAPNDGEEHPEWTFHIHYYPPLLRSATIKKFMVGYEMLAMPQRDITPEEAAERLRGCSLVHYKEGK